MLNIFRHKFTTVVPFLFLGNIYSIQVFALTQDETEKLVQEIDYRQTNTGDYKALSYIEQKERDKDALVYEAQVYRRDADDKWMLLFTKPKTEAGKGYLRANKNMFMYDPAIGKWERRTERERIAGTNSRRSDFDEPNFSKDYTPKFIADEKLGKFSVYHLELKQKDNADVAYPIIHLWIDIATSNVLKQQNYSLSGKLMRTNYTPKWEKVFSKSKNSDVYIPKEMRILDEIEKGNSTTVLIKEVDLNPLEANIFTKAWLEGKSK